MPLSYASEGCKFEEDLQDPREAHHLEPGQLDASEEEAAAGSQSSPSACSSPRALDAAPWSQSEEESTSSQEEEGPHTSQEPAEAQAPPQETLQEKVADLVYFLLHKYRAKMLTSQAEILREVLDDNLEHFPVAFRRACECLQLVFGLEVQEAEPNGDSYVLVTTLGLTYDGLMRPEEIMPKTGLLVIVLAVILLNGDRSPEERMWEALGAVGVFAGLEHIIYGEPRALLTEVWVQEQYLEYQQVPHSDPPRYEFLWGPRAYAETNKVDVLEYFIRVNSRNSRSF